MDESGQVGGIESVLFGLLLFVFGSLAIASAWAVIDAKVATASAAREATRSWVESDGTMAAWAQAEARGQEAFSGTGRAGTGVQLSPSGTFERCAPVSVTASTRVALPRVPVLRTALRRLTVASTHTELVDPLRSGLARSSRACI